jgi:hypothetical protein
MIAQWAVSSGWIVLLARLRLSQMILLNELRLHLLICFFTGAAIIVLSLRWANMARHFQRTWRLSWKATIAASSKSRQHIKLTMLSCKVSPHAGCKKWKHFGLPFSRHRVDSPHQII